MRVSVSKRLSACCAGVFGVGEVTEITAAFKGLMDAQFRKELGAKIKRGQLPGPEMSITKMALVNNQAKLVKFLSHTLGPKLIADSGEWGTYAWANFVLGTPGLRIAGGSDEVMRNITGERVLGLPKDLGIDSVSPFRDIKVSK